MSTFVQTVDLLLNKVRMPETSIRTQMNADFTDFFLFICAVGPRPIPAVVIGQQL